MNPGLTRKSRHNALWQRTLRAGPGAGHNCTRLTHPVRLRCASRGTECTGLSRCGNAVYVDRIRWNPPPPLARVYTAMHIRLFGYPEAFEWDLDKAEANEQKHGIRFLDAVRVFDGPTFDTLTLRFGELRVAAVGLLEGVEVTVVYVVRGSTFRMISARRASRDERRAYGEIYP